MRNCRRDRAGTGRGGDRAQPAPHFHRKMTEIYRGLKGMLMWRAEARGYVLEPGDTLTIEPGNVHFARSAREPAWIKVLLIGLDA